MGRRVRELHGGAAKLADDQQVRHNVQGIGGGGEERPAVGDQAAGGESFWRLRKVEGSEPP
jgi:hypothetical protein